MKYIALIAFICALIVSTTQVLGQSEQAEMSGQDAEILVTARKLKIWKGAVHSRGGTIACRTVRTSGDAAIDKIGCDALRTCFAAHYPAIAEADKSEKRQRKERVSQTNKALGACLVTTRKQLISDFVESRHN